MTEVLAIIPARGGSKGVPGKNRTPVAGIPLVQRAVHACVAAAHVTRVAVSTDDDAIAALAEQAGATVVRRPAEIAGDTASSESAMVHALSELYPDPASRPEVIMLVQCTSPFITADEVDRTASAVTSGEADSAFTAASFHGFVWRQDEWGHGVNHDHSFRPRRQDRPLEYLETGAAYAMRTEEFLEVGHRFFGRIRIIPTDPSRVLEIDEPADLERARLLAPLIETRTTQLARSDIDAVVTDFDGTQTDDRAWITADGKEIVAVHRGDGMGISALVKAGLPVLILSTEVNPVVRARAAKLGIECIHAVTDKAAALEQWAAAAGLDLARVAFVGNDINDLGCLHRVGWPIAVASAHESVRAAARLVTNAAGGYGAIREVASWILGKELQG